MAETTLAPVDDPHSLAREMAAAFRSMAAFYRDEMELAPDEANRQALAPARRDLAQMPPDQISWWMLAGLMEHDAAEGAAVWERLKAQARAELSSGHRVALAMTEGDTPWQRAQFLAIRQAFIDEWQPAGGLELALIDQLAIAHSSALIWLARLHVQASTEVQLEELDRSRSRSWKPSRIPAAAAIDQSAAMADRFNRLFLRSLRALRDLRRYGPVIVQNAGQVNVAERQVNLNQSDYTRELQR